MRMKKNATEAMISWAKSGKSEVTEDLQQILEVYFNDNGSNNGHPLKPTNDLSNVSD